VSISVKEKSLKDIVDILREQTGANIVLNESNHENINKPISVTLNETKLFTVLKVIADQFELAPAVVDNVFYVTTMSKASQMNQETSRLLFGENTPAAAVYVPVDADGRFVPNSLDKGQGGGHTGGPQLIPVRVGGGGKANGKATTKPAEPKTEGKP
jgi:hypothetical protein